MVTAKMSLRALARQVMEEQTDRDGRCDLAVVRAELVKALQADPIDRDSRPRANGQMSMFDADARIPVGEAVRVKMACATLRDMLAWHGIDAEEHRQHIEAYAAKLQYRNSRIAAWQSHHATLGDVERDVFGGP
jgi:hypothetical protein